MKMKTNENKTNENKNRVRIIVKGKQITINNI